MLSQIYDLLIESEQEFSNGRKDMGHILLLEALRLLRLHNDANK